MGRERYFADEQFEELERHDMLEDCIQFDDDDLPYLDEEERDLFDEVEYLEEMDRDECYEPEFDY